MKTLKVDSSKRVRLGQARPGDCYQIQASVDGLTFTLTKIVPDKSRPAKVRFEKRGRYRVGIVDRPIDEQALKEALEDFP